MFQSFTRQLAVLLWMSVATVYAQVTLTDDLQRIVRLDQVAHRVVSLAPSITESLFAIGAGTHVVGVTDYCNFPPEAKTIAHVGGMVNPSTEAIVALKPDVIIMSMEGNLRQDFTALTSLGVPVYVTNPRTLDGIHHSLLALGRITGRTAQAESLVRSLTTRERAIIKKNVSSLPSVIFLVSLQPLIAVGAKTFVNELLTSAHARNIAGTAGVTYPMISREYVIAANPDVILLTSDLLSDVGQLATLFPEWSRLTAVRTRRIYRMDADLVSRPGPRATDGLESLYATIHTGSR